MKQLFLSISVITLTMLFSGCTNTKDIPLQKSAQGVSYKVVHDKDDNVYTVYVRDREYRKVENRYGVPTEKKVEMKRKVLDAQLRIAAEETRKMGYNYFALTGIDVANLSGFPINTKKDLIRYATLSDRDTDEHFRTGKNFGDYRALISESEYILEFTPVSDELANSGTVFVWNVNDNL